MAAKKINSTSKKTKLDKCIAKEKVRNKTRSKMNKVNPRAKCHSTLSNGKKKK
jgi:hypothetical protein